MPLNRTKNPEKYLMAEMEAAVTGKALPSSEYLQHNYDNPSLSLDGAGSANWPVMALAVHIIKNYDGWLAVAIDYYEKSQTRVWGHEIGSRHTYHEMHLKSALAILGEAVKHPGKESAHLQLLIIEQLQWLYGMYLAGEDSRGWVGQRSADTPACLPWLDGFFKWSTNKTLSQPERKWITGDVVVNKHIGLLRKALDPVIGKPAQEILRSVRHGTLVPYFVYRTASGMAIWTMETINGNTQAVLGYVREGARQEWAPKDRGPDAFFHQRSRKPGRATCGKSGGNLFYESPIYGNLSLALPSGPPLEFYTFGGDRMFSDLRPSEGVVETPIPPTLPVTESPAKPVGGKKGKSWPWTEI